MYSKNQVIEICETQSRIVTKIAECVINRRIPDAECRLRIVDLLHKLGVLSETQKPEPEKPRLELLDGYADKPELPAEAFQEAYDAGATARQETNEETPE